MQGLWRGAGVSNNTLLAVECDGPVAPDRLRRAVDRYLDHCPWPAARLRRPFPWGKLHWRAAPRTELIPPPVRRQVVSSDHELHHAMEAELDAAIEPARESPLRFLVLQSGSGASARHVLVLTWFHPLMDPRGGQNLLADLAALDDDADGPLRERPRWPYAPAPETRPLKERGALARHSLAYMRTLASTAPVSPGTQLTSPGGVRFRVETFPDLADHHGTRDTRTISWRLAVVGKAMARLWERRQLPDVPFLVPISVDLRPKGEPGPTFGNTLAFHFARFEPAAARDVPALSGLLRHQMAGALRDHQIEANAVAMEFLHYRPVSRMLRAFPWTSARETFSFNCADVADFPSALEAVFGRRILNAYHVPAVLPRPGVGVFFNRCGGTNNVVVSWIERAVSEDEVTGIIDVIGEEMGWRERR